MFACAHPAIERGMRAPLILQTILGLTAEEIAAAFLIPPATMGKRLVRAKMRTRDAGIPFRIPEKEELPERLQAVLDAIYAAYSKGWNEVGEEGVPEIADEAIWLGRLVVSLMPEEPEAKGMLALMFYAEARRAARRDAAGAYVPLEEQDATLWDDVTDRPRRGPAPRGEPLGPDRPLPARGGDPVGAYGSPLTGRSNWSVVVQLYDHLLALTGSPVVVLNRAVALAELDGPEAALAAIEPLSADARMLSYQPFWAAKGHLLARTGAHADAAEAYRVAIGLTTDEAVRAYLRDKLASLQQG